MNSFDIRKKFLDFFEQHNHTVVPSSSLIPAEDPTLLFTNAGMNQFKDLFLGKEKRSYVRATSSQKCVRAGGKHNDLDAVGFTERHLTFFEMLGNFSFGDYFKKEAIEFAWDLLTKHLHLPPEKLFVTVFTTDDEAYEIWNKVVGIPPERIFRLGEKDNFWAMGETGPCGPCSEIYYDRGPEKQGPFEHASPGSDSPRYIEIWNLVFMQYNRQTDGALQPLTQTGVDTGMGLERLCMVLQGKDNVYHTDLFTTLIKALEELTGISYAAGDDNLKAAFHVLGDHVRSSSLLIADGCSPANDGRGYVLRKIIRRAALFAQKLSDDQQLLAKLAEHFITHMGIIFPELVTNKSLIINLLNSEIERFSANLVQGQNILAKFVEEQTRAGSTIIPGEHMFKLYDTYGFPPELTQLMAQERGFSIDLPAFETEMKKQQELSGKKNKEAVQDIFVTENVSTKFVGYETLETTSRILFSSIIDNEAWIITEESPFYVECGGQVNDHGWVTINGHTFDVVDLKKTGDHKHPAIAIKLALPVGPTPEINVGDSAHSKVNEQTRMETVRNHTATHMLQAALIEILGKQVKQAGSLVCASYLRFDFTHHEAMTKNQIEAVENLVNQKIQEAIPTNIFNTTLQDAKTQGVISFFGEKYNPENVRVVQIPGFSAELCGGTHAHNTGIIGAFKITSDTALSTGVRRLFAVTGPEALKLFQQSFSSTKKLSEEFKVKQDDVVSAVAKLQEHYSHALTQIKQLKKQLIKSQLPDWKLEMKNIGPVPFLYRELDDVQGDELKGIATELEKIAPGFYCLVTKLDNRFGFFAYVAKQHEAQIDLKKFAEFLKVTWNLKGGGSSKQIQGGGQQLPEQFAEKVAQWLSGLI